MTTSLAFMSTSLTPEQLEHLEIATSGSFIRMEGRELFSIVLLEAIKQNSKVHTLEMYGAASMQCDVAQALGDCLCYHANIMAIKFNSQEYDWRFRRPGRDFYERHCDYTTLIKAIANSPSLRVITVHGDLSMELGEAIMEGLKYKQTFTTLKLICSSLIMKNPIGFGDLLATGQGIDSLILQTSDCYDVCGTTSLWDGIQKSQSLTTIDFYLGVNRVTTRFILESLEGNQSVKHLTPDMSDVALHPEMALLVTKMIPRLASLSVNIFEPSTNVLDALCKAVPQSQTIKKLYISHPYSFGVSHMLKQSTSLQELDIRMRLGCSEMEELAVGVKACKTLTTLSGNWGCHEQGMQAFLDMVLVKHNLTAIHGLDSRERFVGADVEGKQRNANQLCKEVHFYLAFNKEGRSLVGADMKSCLWPHALQKAGRSSLPDALYYYLQETPELVMYHGAKH